MGYMDGLINSWFKKSKNGKLLFYPYGKFSSGYAIDYNIETKIRQFLKIYFILSFLITIIFTILFKLYALLILFIFVLIYIIKMKQILSSSDKIKEKIKLKEVTKNMATSMGFPTTVIMLLASLLMLSASIFYALSQPNKDLIKILCILFFGLCFLQSISLVVYSFKFRKNR